MRDIIAFTIFQSREECLVLKHYSQVVTFHERNDDENHLLQGIDIKAVRGVGAANRHALERAIQLFLGIMRKKADRLPFTSYRLQSVFPYSPLTLTSAPLKCSNLAVTNSATLSFL